MGYPVAYRRSSPVRRVQPNPIYRGSQTYNAGRGNIRFPANTNFRQPAGGIAGGGGGTIWIDMFVDFYHDYLGFIPYFERVKHITDALRKLWDQFTDSDFDENLPTQGGGVEYDMTGWTKYCGSSAGTLYANSYNCALNALYEEQAVYDAKIGKLLSSWQWYANFVTNVAPYPPGPFYGWVHGDVVGRYGHAKGVGFNTEEEARGDIEEQTPPYYDLPIVEPRQRPDVPPNVDPEQMPIGQPVPEYAPLPYWLVPYRRPNAWRSPLYQSWRGPQPTGDPKPRRKTDPQPKRKPEPEPEPNPKPEAKPGFSVGVDGWLNAPPAWSPPRPAPRYTKERKVVIAVGGKIAFLANHVSEYKDFIEAWWKAIPRDLRSRKKPKLIEMLREIYDHFEDIDLPQAIKNMIVNEIIDRTYGKAGQYARLGKRSAVGTGYDPGAAGYQLGGRYRPRPNVKGTWDPSIDAYLPKFSMRDVYKAVGWR